MSLTKVGWKRNAGHKWSGKETTSVRVKIHRVISNPQIFQSSPGTSSVFAESTQAMGCERIAKSKFVDDETAHSGDDSDLDEPLSNLALTDPEEARNIQLDQQFINDEQELPLDDESSSDGKEEAPPVAVRRSGRLNRTGSAQEPRTKAVVVSHHAEQIDFGSSDSEQPTKSYSTSEDEKVKRKKRTHERGKDVAKRKPRAKQSRSSKSKSNSPKRKTGKAPALYKMIGKAFRECARAYGNEFEEGRFGFYDAWSDGDLPVVEFHSACEWFKNNFNFHSLGRERGEKMGKLHSQGHGGAYAPYTKAGCNALAQRYKEDMGIETNSRRKIQFKLLDVIDQPEDKMCAYTRKFRAFQEFLFHSSDRSGDKYTEEYLDMCDEKYLVKPPSAPRTNICFAD